MSFIHPMLSLRVASYNDEPLAEPITVTIGPDGGTIGRATTCTLVLPDQQRAISRVHARVEYRAGEYLLCDLGSNPSVLNQRALGGTREARLAAGDQLMIGAYRLEVSIGESAAPPGERPFAGDPLAHAQVLGGAPFSEPLDLRSGGAPGAPQGGGGLDALGQAAFGAGEGISTRPGFAGSESDHVSPEWQAFAPPKLVPSAASPGSGPPGVAAGGGIPADYDPLADALAQWEGTGGTPVRASTAAPAVPLPAPLPGFPPPSAPAPAPGGGLASGGPTGLPASLLGDPVSGGGATPFDDLFAPGAVAPSSGVGAAVSAGPSSGVQPLWPDIIPPIEPAPRASVADVAAVQPPPPSPPVQMQAPPRAATNEAPRTAPTPPETSAQPPVAAPVSVTQPAAATPAQNLSPQSASPDPTLAALLEGLGIDPSRAPGLAAADLARLAGAMLRESLRGTMAVLRARTMTKREARLDTTLIVERDNNPLKFFPDVDSALAQMLGGRGGGYLPPDEAVARAFVDIESHELAVLAGMRAALAQVLARFDPATLEAQITMEGVLDRVLSNRKAKLWDRFVALQEYVAREADDDFQKLFGKAFNEAYEAQVDAMQRARKGGKPDSN